MKTGGYVVLQRVSTVLRHFLAEEAAAAAVPANAGASGSIGGRGSGRLPIFDFDDCPPEITEMVRRALEDEARKDTTEPASDRSASTPPSFEESNAEDIAEAINLLFTAPALAALDEAKARSAKATARAAIDRLEAERRRAFIFARDRAAEADDEAALMAILQAL